jgi:hypothetical protein
VDKQLNNDSEQVCLALWHCLHWVDGEGAANRCLDQHLAFAHLYKYILDNQEILIVN